MSSHTLIYNIVYLQYKLQNRIHIYKIIYHVPSHPVLAEINPPVSSHKVCHLTFYSQLLTRCYSRVWLTTSFEPTCALISGNSSKLSKRPAFYTFSLQKTVQICSYLTTSLIFNIYNYKIWIQCDGLADCCQITMIEKSHASRGAQ